MIDSNIPKIPILLAAAGLAVALVLGFALNPTPAFAKPPCKGQDKDTLDCGGIGGGSGGTTEIALCATLEFGGGIGITQLNEGDMFCDDAGLDAAIIDGVLGVSLGRVRPRGQLDFRSCVDVDHDNDETTADVPDPNCDNIDFDFFDPLIVRGGDGDDREQLVSVAFSTGNTDEALDFAAMPIDPMPEEPPTTKLVVRFEFIDSIVPSEPKHTRRTINYGPRDGECDSDMVTVTRLAEGCWEVVSIFDPNYPDLSDKACLIRDSGKGNNPETLLQGTYHMPFTMRLAEFGDSFDSNTGEPIDLVDECLPPSP